MRMMVKKYTHNNQPDDGRRYHGELQNTGCGGTYAPDTRIVHTTLTTGKHRKHAEEHGQDENKNDDEEPSVMMYDEEQHEEEKDYTS